MCLHWERHQDPLFFLARQQLELRVKVVKRVNIGSWRLLGQVWQTSLETLRRTKHRWQVVKGPLAACQAMLLDHGWLPDEVDKWHDPAGACWHVDYACPFAVGRLWEALAESIAREQWRRVAESPQFTGVAKGVDFTAPKRTLKQALVAEVTAEPPAASVLFCKGTSSS